MPNMEGIRPGVERRRSLEIFRVPFSTVLEHFDREHDLSETREWARELINTVNDFYSGEWHSAKLPNDLVRSNITLMYHHHPLEGEPLVPEIGATVAETSARFREIENSYHACNNKCCEHIKSLQASPFSHLILASNDGRFKIPDQYQQKLQQRPGTFLHIDGLHRMIAWDLAGRLSDSNDGSVEAYIAGPIMQFPET